MIVETLTALGSIAAIAWAFDAAWSRSSRSSRSSRKPAQAKLAPHVLLCPWCEGSIGRHMDWCEAFGAGHRRPITPHVDTRRVE